MKNLTREAVTLLNGQADEVVEVVGADEAVPDQVVQAVHQLQGEFLKIVTETKQLFEYIGHDAASILVQ